MPHTHFGKAMRALREKRKLSCRQAGEEKLFLAECSVRNVENCSGTSNHPKITTIVEYARGYNASRAELRRLVLAALEDIIEEEGNEQWRK